MSKHTANTADADVFAKDEVHDGLGEFFGRVARPVMENGIQEHFHRFASRFQGRGRVGGGGAGVKNLEASFELNLVEVVGGRNRSVGGGGAKKGLAMFQGGKDSVARAFIG